MHIADYPTCSDKVVNSLNASVYGAGNPEHLRASQTCSCLELPFVSDTILLQEERKIRIILDTIEQARVSFVNGIDQTNHSFAFVKQSCAAVTMRWARCAARVAELLDVAAWLERVFELFLLTVLWLRALLRTGGFRRRRLSNQSGEGEVTAPKCYHQARVFHNPQQNKERKHKHSHFRTSLPTFPQSSDYQAARISWQKRSTARCTAVKHTSFQLAQSHWMSCTRTAPAPFAATRGAAASPPRVPALC